MALPLNAPSGTVCSHIIFAATGDCIFFWYDWKITIGIELLVLLGTLKNLSISCMRKYGCVTIAGQHEFSLISLLSL